MSSTRIDPRQVPALGTDAHLPAVPMAQLAIAPLRQRFLQPPPWTPERVHEGRWTPERPSTAAAVLVALVARDQGLQVLLTQRSAHLPTHAGQIAFAGGKCDAQDATVQDAALREAQEELGLHPRHVEVLGEMPLYTTGTGFHITPVVALVHPPFELQPNAGEVDEVFEVPLAYLMNPAHHHRHQAHWQGAQRHWYSMPYIEPSGGPERFIWGATAGMIRNFYRFLLADMPAESTP